MSQAKAVASKPKGDDDTPMTPTSGMPKRIGRQLYLIGLSVIALFALELAIEMALNDNEPTSNVFILPATIGVLLLLAFGIVQWLAPHADPIFLPVIGFMSGLGLVYVRRLNVHDNGITVDASIFSGTGGRQLMSFIAALVVFAVVLWFVKSHRDLIKYAYTLGFLGVFLAALPGLLPASISGGAYGSKRWINFPGFAVQPAEFAKFMLLIFFAYYLVRKRDVLSVAGAKFLGVQWPRAKDLLPVVVLWMGSMSMLVLERDLGSSLLFFGMFVSMLYMVTRRVSWILIGLTSFVAGCVAIYPFFDHLQLRVRIWLDPFNADYVYGDSHQLVQGLIAMGSGGLLGNGPGAGHPLEVAFADSDFILASLGEELGMVGLIAVLVLYALIVVRAFKTGLMLRDQFGKILAAGLGFGLGFQVFVICAGVTGLIPLTGFTAPWLSLGGSSMVANWVLAALLIRLSHESRKPWQPGYGLNKVEAPPEYWEKQREKEARERAAVEALEQRKVAAVADNPTELVSLPRTQDEEADLTSSGTREESLVDLEEPVSGSPVQEYSSPPRHSTTDVSPGHQPYAEGTPQDPAGPTPSGPQSYGQPSPASGGPSHSGHQWPRFSDDTFAGHDESDSSQHRKSEGDTGPGDNGSHR
ncbi:FtsW/RodA/SpoVE family cell cycle protein [Natronoglycomyces albus]|uniref:FtsW/RodA/SpoVE family cell cycle protein n=1 Tax=Natronoglycomyces albus TaxID=2811108 RepID=A0A895XR75_9ACTN|nr:FtsW/RodA/SpoVE family cell cycle protein [Natronoglycomyces albus]QSB05665.1 FtsW/RodA/SpoVE family cell cycle protein [Natronoglycomyces albus]